MYLPTSEEQKRRAITDAFMKYREQAASQWPKYSALEHWAKVELPAEKQRFTEWKTRTGALIPLERYSELRRWADPKNILGNRIVDSLTSPDE